MRWAFKEDEDYSQINQLYHEIGGLLTDTISMMKDQLKLPNQEI